MDRRALAATASAGAQRSTSIQLPVLQPEAIVCGVPTERAECRGSHEHVRVAEAVCVRAQLCARTNGQKVRRGCARVRGPSEPAALGRGRRRARLLPLVVHARDHVRAGAHRRAHERLHHARLGHVVIVHEQQPHASRGACGGVACCAEVAPLTLPDQAPREPRVGPREFALELLEHSQRARVCGGIVDDEQLSHRRQAVLCAPRAACCVPSGGRESVHEGLDG
mmetsp:Transcript_16263/g.42136  ORF Transcript_16263/g.42136 Transcript_16263/m.42136 type:complete len:224 (+) Transcript_16263:722-1393(+)